MYRFLGTVLLLSGCATSQPEIPAGGSSTRQVTRIEGSAGSMEITQTLESSVSRATLAAAPEAVWSALQATYADLGIPVNVSEPQVRLIGAQEQRVRRIAQGRPSRFLDCGSGLSGPNADRHDIYLTVLTQLHPAPGGGSEIRTQLEAQSKDPVQSSAAVRCGSTGALERLILSEVQKRLGS